MSWLSGLGRAGHAGGDRRRQRTRRLRRARLLGQPTATAWTVAASLGQIAEFSFILAGLGVGLGILPPEGRDLILAGAILSILINPFLFTAVERGRVRWHRIRLAIAGPRSSRTVRQSPLPPRRSP